MNFKSLHAVSYFIPLGSPFLDVTTLRTYRVAPYFIPLGSPPPLEGLGEVPLRPSPLTRSLSHLLLKELRELSL